MRGRLVLGAFGAALVGWGALGLLRDAADTRPLEVAGWLGILVVTHDLLLAPVVAAVAWVVARALPGAAGRAVRGGLVVGGVLLLVSVPLLLRGDVARDNASALPRDYESGTALVLGLVAAGTAGAAVIARRRRDPRRRLPDTRR